MATIIVKARYLGKRYDVDPTDISDGECVIGGEIWRFAEVLPTSRDVGTDR